MGYPFVLRILVGAMVLIMAASALAKPPLHFSGDKGEPVDVASYTYSTPSARPLAVRLSLEKPDAERVRRLMSANLGARVKVTIGSQSVLTPTVRAVPSGNDIEVTLEDQKAFDSIKASLAEDH